MIKSNQIRKSNIYIVKIIRKDQESYWSENTIAFSDHQDAKDYVNALKPLDYRDRYTIEELLLIS